MLCVSDIIVNLGRTILTWIFLTQLRNGLEMDSAPMFSLVLEWHRRFPSMLSSRSFCHSRFPIRWFVVRGLAYLSLSSTTWISA